MTRTGATGQKPTRRGPGVRWLLLGVASTLVLLPVVAVLGLRVYQNHLVRATEANLIGQSVVVAESYRAFLLEESGEDPGPAARARSPGATDERWAPVEPALDMADDMAPPIPDPDRRARTTDGQAWRAGARLVPLLERAQIANLSGCQVLDREGCIVASTGQWRGLCVDDIPEVTAALAGAYTAAARQRVSDEPKPPFSSISRRGDVRVFTALPIHDKGRVIGAVWMSRTSMDPLKAAWLERRPLALALGGTLLLAALVSLFLARAITRPLRRITEAARAVARGEPGGDLAPGGLVPAEIHDLGESLRTMTGQLARRAAYVAAYAADVTHELKSPITAIRGAVELLEEDDGRMTAEQRARFVANIGADAARMERLVARLLELARIENAESPAGRADLDGLFDRLREVYDGRVGFGIEPGVAGPPIHAEHLESALRNLIDNALRHGEGRPVEVRARAGRGRVALAVENGGPPIPDEHLGRLFDRFFTTERDRGGTGLGLAIVKAVAESRGGSVRCESGPERTVFTLEI
jgi:signal transduction histidine kinase